MEVLLLNNVKTLGQSGEVVRVSEGYARNFLFPRKLAMTVTGGILKNAELHAKNRRQQLEKKLKGAEALKQKLESIRCEISVKVGKDDKLFGSVTNADIAASLAKQEIVLDRRMIDLSEPIRTLGSHQVRVKVHTDVEASLAVLVSRQ